GEGILQNKSNGGEGASGRVQTFETRKKISESKIGENNPSYGKTGEKAFHYGKRHSEETRNKLRELNTGENSHRYGKKHSEETKEKMSKSALGENNPMYGRTGKNNPNYGKILPQVVKNKLR
ncbi:MAG: NUMOD3 domain-containing DNA-binding protein, partial [Bacteroidota bacterium]